MSGIFKFIFGDVAAVQPPQQQQAPIIFPAIPPPAAVPPPPDRSDSQVQQDAMRARLAFSSEGGRSVNNLTGGLGVPSGSTYSAVTSVLGGVGR